MKVARFIGLRLPAACSGGEQGEGVHIQPIIGTYRIAARPVSRGRRGRKVEEGYVVKERLEHDTKKGATFGGALLEISIGETSTIREYPSQIPSIIRK